MQKALAIIRNHSGKKIAVLSACSGVTNLLHNIVSNLSAATSAYREGNLVVAEEQYVSAKNILDEIIVLHREIIKELLPKNSSLPIFEFYLRKIRQRILGSALLRRLTEKNARAIVSMGEYLSTAIFTEYCRSNNENVQWLDTYSILTKTVTDTGFSDSAIDIIAKELRKSDTLVLQGYIRKGLDGELDNFGRGGSDYSAALLGKLIGAAKIEIYTDVDGVYSADPRKVPDAKIISNIEPRIMGMMASFGAKVMHPDSLRPAIEANIPVYIKNTFSNSPGTVVRSNEVINQTTTSIPSITYTDDITKFIVVKPSTAISALSSFDFNDRFLYTASNQFIETIYVRSEHENDLIDILADKGLDFQKDSVTVVLITSLGRRLSFYSLDNKDSYNMIEQSNNLSFSIFRDNLLFCVGYMGKGSYLFESSRALSEEEIAEIHDIIIESKQTIQLENV